MSSEADEFDGEFTTIEQIDELFDSDRTSGVDVSSDNQRNSNNAIINLNSNDSNKNDDSYSSIDSDLDGNDDETVTFSAIRSLEASYRGKCYPIYHLDLDEDERNSLLPVHSTSVMLDISNRDIHIEDGNLSIKRISIKSTASPIQYEYNQAMAQQTQTERILFSENEPLLAKYKDSIYFVDKNLKDEYKFLLRRSGYPMGTPIRIKKDRLLFNDFEHILSIRQRSTQFQKDQKVIVLKPPSGCDAVVGSNVENDQDTVLKDIALSFDRYLSNECGELHPIEKKLMFSDWDAYFTELYGEPDYAIDRNEQIRKVDPRLSKETLKLSPLPNYPASDEVRELVRWNFVQNPGHKFSVEAKELLNKVNTWLEQSPTTRLTKRTQIDLFETLIQFEDMAQQKYIATFNRKNISIIHEHDRFFYFYVTKYTRELVVGVDERKLFDFVLIPMSQIERPPKNKKDGIHIYGTVVRSYEDKIYLELHGNSNKVKPKELYFIEFVCNRLPVQMERQAMHFMQKHGLSEFFFAERCGVNDLVMGKLSTQMERLNNNKIEMELSAKQYNREQISAIKSILGETSYPYPYVLFGPPGTGKTRTLVGAIEYIVQLNKHVLVCATSNSACDEICSRLLKILPKGIMYRLYSSSVQSEFIDSDLKRISNFSDDIHFFPPLSYLYEFQVVCCTLATAGRLVQARADKAVFNEAHFDYVCIDECGSATEPAALIPIAGLCTSPKRIEATIVLAGDPKQLGPIVQSKMASNLGYDSSLLERLMNLNIYSRDAKTRKFNNKYITQLVCNYRSHPAILEVPNRLFYENVLKAKASQNDINWFLSTTILPSPKFPIIFAAVQGKCLHDEDDPSYYNKSEVQKVIYFLDKLLHQKVRYRQNRTRLRKFTIDDVGIISPYKKQCKKIRMACRNRGWDGIQIGSVEVFQGKEKPIIIVSTVRSDGRNIGFLDNPKRLNVLLTRAKCLLIMIGDPITLSMNDNWREVINHCMENDAMIYD